MINWGLEYEGDGYMAFWMVKCARALVGCGSQYALKCEDIQYVRNEAMRFGWQEIGLNGEHLLCPSCQVKHEPFVGSGILGGIGQKYPEKEMSVKEFAAKLSKEIYDTVVDDSNIGAFYLRRLARLLQGMSK